MVGQLITLPLRAGIGATRLWLKVVGETVAVAADATGRVIDTVVSRPVAQPAGPSRDEPTPTPTAAPTPSVAHISEQGAGAEVDAVGREPQN
jgi:hypothetical protein